MKSDHYCWKTINFIFILFHISFQQKLKEEREAKRAQLDDRHDYILVTVADALGLDKSEVEDAILEGTQVSYCKMMTVGIVQCLYLEKNSS